MLSRVLADTDGEFEPMAWRSTGAVVPAAHAAAAAVAPASVPAPSHSESKADLKARIDEINASVEQRLRQAYESGLREGAAAGKKEAEAGLHDVVQRLTSAIDEVTSMRSDAIRRAETDVVRLSMEIARRILHRELSVDASALEPLIKAALDKLRTQDIYRVRVHPAQEQLVRNCLEQSGRNAAIEVVGDPSQPRGAAVFEISRGSLDASVDTQLREIERGLADRLGDR
jgi:flagellar assembly protein FliH